MNRIELYKEIKSIAVSEMSELALVDLQKGQFNPNIDNSSLLPALLVEFGSVEYETNVKGVQNGRMNVSLYLYQGITEDLTEEERELENTEILNRIDSIYQVFTGVKSDSFSPLTRRAEEVEEGFADYLTISTDDNGLLVLNPTEWGQQFHCVRVDFTTEVLDELEDTVSMYQVENINIDSGLL